ncbi:MAG: TIGR03088 family PEP-CTERM/XrtA system glycosyltransferase [Pseudomonadota bacterium]
MSAPLIAHVITRLAIGGLENGLVNLINAISPERYRHAIVCMEDFTDFRERIQAPGVDVIAMHKRPGQDPGAQWRLFKRLREMRPAILHTRNLTALDALFPAMLAGVSRRVHGEHGRDVDDPDGTNVKWQIVRKVHRPLVKHFITVSQDLEGYLCDKIGVAPNRVTQIYNGVDTERFRPPQAEQREPLPAPSNFAPDDAVVIGTVGRLQPIKHQILLARAFAQLLAQAPHLRGRARLAIVGDGDTFGALRAFVHEAGIAEQSWLPGARNDVEVLYRGFDLFVLPSLGEGISNTILEAMASGRPVVATAVGGNVELVEDGVTGCLVPSDDVQVLADTLQRYVEDSALRARQSEAARADALARYSMEAMVGSYLKVYDELMARR